MSGYFVYPSERSVDEAFGAIDSKRNFTLEVRGRLRAHLIMWYLPFLLNKERDPPFFRSLFANLFLVGFLAIYGKAATAGGYGIRSHFDSSLRIEFVHANCKT